MLMEAWRLGVLHLEVLHLAMLCWRARRLVALPTMRMEAWHLGAMHLEAWRRAVRDLVDARAFPSSQDKFW